MGTRVGSMAQHRVAAAALLIALTSVVALPVMREAEEGQVYIPGGAEEESTMDMLRDRQSQIALDIAHTKSSAPVDVQPELGETDTTKRVASLKDEMMTLHKGLKIWKKGETKSGDEDFNKLNGAIGHAEKGALKKAWTKGEHMLEKAAIDNHEKHPRAFAKEGAESLEKGMNMALKFTGDDVANVEKAPEAKEEGQKGDHYGAEVVDDYKKSDKVVAMAKENYVKKRGRTPKRAVSKMKKMGKKEVKVAMEAAKWALAKVKHDTNPNVKKRDEKLAKIIEDGAKKMETGVKDAVHLAEEKVSKKASRKPESFLQLRESSKPGSFKLPPQAIPSIHPLVRSDEAKVIAKQEKVDSAVQAAMQRVEKKMKADFAPASKKKAGTSSNAQTSTQKEATFLRGLKVMPLPDSLLQTGAPTDTYNTQPTPGYALPAVPVPSVGKGVQADIAKAMAHQKQLEAQEEASVEKEEKENDKLFAAADPQDMQSGSQRKALDAEISKATAATEQRSVAAGQKSAGIA